MAPPSKKRHHARSINKPELKPEAAPIWNMYHQIKKGCADITYQELHAYQSLVGELSAWEVELMIEIDVARKTAT